MDQPTKLLIRGACIAIIAGFGYYLWTERQVVSARDQQQSRIEAARAELFRFAEAGKGQDDKVRNWCKTLLARQDTVTDKELASQLVTNCRALGYLF